MATGSAVICRTGPRSGKVWYLRWRDASGKLVKERLGSEAEGWTKRKAKQALQERLADVRREGLKRPERVGFADAAEAWLDSLDGLKATTTADYEGVTRRHLIGYFRDTPLAEIDAATVEAYLKAKRSQGIGNASLGGHLNRLKQIFEHAHRLEQVSDNPVARVKRPKVAKERRWGVLTPEEIGGVERAFRQLVDDADGEERRWREQARVLFLTATSTGLRRGELLGLTWRDVRLTDPERGPTVQVERQWVRGHWQRRSPRRLRGRCRSAHGSLTNCSAIARRHASPATTSASSATRRGSALDHGRYAATFRQALALAGIERRIRPFHDGRHTALTHLAASGAGPVALMALAGHTNFAVTKGYLDLDQAIFRAEAEAGEQRIFGEVAEARP